MSAEQQKKMIQRWVENAPHREGQEVFFMRSDKKEMAYTAMKEW